MFSILTDTLPKPVLAGLTVWAGVSYFVTGPEAGTRISRADFVPACASRFKDVAMQAGEERLRSLPMPSFDPMQELAIAQARRLQNNPFMDQLRIMSGGRGDIFGLGETANAALRQIEQTRRAAERAYDASLEKIRQETAGRVARADDVCSCVADMAVSQTRLDWAIYAGSLTLIAPQPVKAFDEQMARVYSAGSCTAAKGGA